MALVDAPSLASCSDSSLRITLKPESTTPVPYPPRHIDFASDLDESFDHVELSSYLDGLHIEGIDVLNTLDSMTAFSIPLHDNDMRHSVGASPYSLPPNGQTTCLTRGSNNDRLLEDSIPFRKWMKALHRRARHRADSVDNGHDTSGDPSSPVCWSPQSPRRAHHRSSSSGSSFDFVAAVKSASVSLASASIVTRPMKDPGLACRHSRTERSSRASFTAARVSEDSGYGDRTLAHDPAATERSLQRRRILEELISTEEGYIGDVRFLMNVYVTLLASLPTLPLGMRSSINRNLTDIIQLHEEILSDLHRVVPDSEYALPDFPRPPAASTGQGHRRWRSLDAVPEHHHPAPWIREAPSIGSEAQIAGDVARVFSRKMNQFFIYEEYGAKYEMMIKDMASTQRKMPHWEDYQKGLEALASSLGPVNSRFDQSRKSLTIGDLLVKPIQRMCKYPLLFAELLKYTPVVDDPNSHMEVESALLRLREATAEINRATNDAFMRTTLQKTWILQDRLVFLDQRIDAATKTRIRSFGHIELCGALHVCWQAREGVCGRYMVCLLYNDVLCLASAGKADQIYTIEACISLNGIKVEEPDNGRGLQCHTAPFSWKIVFECDSQLYEMVMTACNPREQDEWRGRLEQSAKECQEQSDPNLLYSSMSLDIRSLGTVFGKPGTVARRISMHRAMTIGSKTPLCQVILKNTSDVREAPALPLNPTINRSQSLLSTSAYRVPVLAPHRAERARLEALLSDIWSRDVLPFPSMTGRSRSENLVRSSASTMMRKLSVTSITSSFTKRSNSVVSMTKLIGEDEAADVLEMRRPVSKLSRVSRSWTEQDGDLHAGPTCGAILHRIRDESEKKDPGNAPTGAALVPTPIEVLGQGSAEAQHHDEDVVMKDIGRKDIKTLQDSPTGGRSVRKGTRRGRPVPPTPRPCSATPTGSVKEEPCSMAAKRAAKKAKLAHGAGPSRWGKVGVLNRDVMIQGIRSFFR
ncbi:hypothetical protein VD0001_g8964 [Verticillium dahliae]|uniref:DH domain-containing protein n=1 Tax=Verticillium dahliae TaxID=27337 RepID=A0A444RWK1_VERDA|nr:hypothetical protein VD0001_g8964 [Verticillium dahliae]RXG45526.1 hypothetical protein VDGE_03133 [Verticillium dahliae]